MSEYDGPDRADQQPDEADETTRPLWSEGGSAQSHEPTGSSGDNEPQPPYPTSPDPERTQPYADSQDSGPAQGQEPGYGQVQEPAYGQGQEAAYAQAYGQAYGPGYGGSYGQGYGQPYGPGSPWQSPYGYQQPGQPQAWQQFRPARPTGNLPGWVWPVVAALALVVGVIGGTLGGVAVSSSMSDESGPTIFETDKDVAAPLAPENGSVAAVAEELLPSTVQIVVRGGGGDDDAPTPGAAPAPASWSTTRGMSSPTTTWSRSPRTAGPSA